MLLSLPKGINRTTKKHREEMEDLVEVYSLMISRESVSAYCSTCSMSHLKYADETFFHSFQSALGREQYAGCHARYFFQPPGHKPRKSPSRKSMADPRNGISKRLRIMQSPFPLSSRILINLGDPLERKEMADPRIAFPVLAQEVHGAVEAHMRFLLQSLTHKP